MKLKKKNKIIVYLFTFAFISSIFQLYLIEVGTKHFISLTFLSSYILGIILLFNYKNQIKEIFKNKSIITLFLFFLIQSVSLLWAKDLSMGIKIIASLTVPYFIFFISSYYISKKSLFYIDRIFLLFFVALLLEAILVIFFRIDLVAEKSFLQSEIAKIFIHPNTLEPIHNNTLMARKAGAFFLNANVAATYLGLSSILLFSISVIKKKWYLYLLSLLFWLSMFFAGSKIATILGVLIPIIMTFHYLIIINKIDIKKKIILLPSIVVIVLAVAIFFISIQSFINNKNIKVSNNIEIFQNRTSGAMSGRINIWKYGYEEFKKKPLKGQGFGGWMTKKNWITNMPPHNTLIYLWSQSGILAPIVALIFMFFILHFGLKLIKSQEYELQILGFGLFYSYLWLFIHGMGTNYGLLGDIHILPLMAVYYGFVYARYSHYNGIK